MIIEISHKAADVPDANGSLHRQNKTLKKKSKVYGSKYRNPGTQLLTFNILFAKNHNQNLADLQL